MFLTLDSDTLCYDRSSPNGTFRLRERIAQSLPSKPKVVAVNLFALSQCQTKEDKVAHLQTLAPLVGSAVNLEVVGL